MSVLGEGQVKVLDLLKNDIIHHEQYEHSYPYDWRTKLPVILRASLQWFIDTESIKQQALVTSKFILSISECIMLISLWIFLITKIGSALLYLGHKIIKKELHPLIDFVELIPTSALFTCAKEFLQCVLMF